MRYHTYELRPVYGSALADSGRSCAGGVGQALAEPAAPAASPARRLSRERHGGAAGWSLIDFQDLIWGFEVQDVAIALLALNIHGDTGRWAAAFRSGYESVRPWPEADPGLTRGARRQPAT